MDCRPHARRVPGPGARAQHRWGSDRSCNPHSLLTIALAPVAGAAGINPLSVGLVALIACHTFFLPYQSSLYLALYHGTGGALFHHAQARPAALAYALIMLIALCASVPAWQAMDLL